MTMLTRTVRLAVALVVAVGVIAAPVSAQPDATRTYHRQLDVYYGTWTVFVQGNPNPIGSQTFVEFTDHISDGLRTYIQGDPSADGRVKSAAPLWVFPPALGNIEWVLGSPESLPAVANFHAAIAALGGSITTDSNPQFLLSPLDRTYLLESFSTVEVAPVSVGDPDGFLFGADGQIVEIDNRFVADVSYFERNGSVTLPAFTCPHSQGYWKNNAAVWPVDSLVLGSRTYTKSELLAILGNSSKQDASLILAKQLIAAKLNVGSGSDPAPIAATISAADALLGSIRVPANVKTTTATGKAMVARAATLETYNSGGLTTTCRP